MGEQQNTKGRKVGQKTIHMWRKGTSSKEAGTWGFLTNLFGYNLPPPSYSFLPTSIGDLTQKTCFFPFSVSPFFQQLQKFTACLTVILSNSNKMVLELQKHRGEQWNREWWIIKQNIMTYMYMIIGGQYEQSNVIHMYENIMMPVTLNLKIIKIHHA